MNTTVINCMALLDECQHELAVFIGMDGTIHKSRHGIKIRAVILRFGNINLRMMADVELAKAAIWRCRDHGG